MFQRRQKLPWSTKVLRSLWPHMGVGRTARYLWYRLHRIRGTSSFIATGFGIGIGSAMMPFYGLHIITGLPIAWALGGSGFAMVIGTFIANPWTEAALWLANYYAGMWILGRDVGTRPNFIRLFKELSEALLTANGTLFVDTIWPVLWPMTVGGIPMALIAGTGAYFVMEPLMRKVQAKRLLKITTGKNRSKAAHAARHAS